MFFTETADFFNETDDFLTFGLAGRPGGRAAGLGGLAGRPGNKKTPARERVGVGAGFTNEERMPVDLTNTFLVQTDSHRFDHLTSTHHGVEVNGRNKFVVVRRVHVVKVDSCAGARRRD